MKTDVSFERSAREYENLYRKVLEKCLEEFFTEIPKNDCPYFHIGSDEVHIEDPKGFMRWIENLMEKYDRQPIAWDPGLPASDKVIRQIWKGCGVGDGFEDCDHETGNYVIEYRGKKRNGFILVAVLGEGINIEGWISAQYLRPICRHCDGYPKTYDSCDAENPKLLYTCRYCHGRGY